MTTVYFIRHGQSVANVEARFAGHSDFPLTEIGEKQARCTAEHVKHINFTAVYASDLLRARDTGAAVADLLNIPIVTNEGLREIFAGTWEGRTFESLQDNADFKVWRENIGLARCTEGESVAELQERVRRTVESIVKAHRGQTVCIATHATPIRVMECIWRGIPLEEISTVPWVSNASVTIAEYDEHLVGRLVSRDEHEHLAELASMLPNNV